MPYTGTAIIHHVTTAGAAKGAGSFALAAGRLTVVIWASHLEAGQSVRAIQAEGSAEDTEHPSFYLSVCM